MVLTQKEYNMYTTLKNFVCRIINNRIKKSGQRYHVFTDIQGTPFISITVDKSEINESLFKYIQSLKKPVNFTVDRDLAISVSPCCSNEVHILIFFKA